MSKEDHENSIATRSHLPEVGGFLTGLFGLSIAWGQSDWRVGAISGLLILLSANLWITKNQLKESASD